MSSKAAQVITDVLSEDVTRSRRRTAERILEALAAARIPAFSTSARSGSAFP